VRGGSAGSVAGAGGRGGSAGSVAGTGGRGGGAGSVAGAGGRGGTGGATCSYGGATYPAGASFPASDGCNTCTCGTNGSVGCTKIACPPRDGGVACALAESYTYGDVGGLVIYSDQVVLGPTSYRYTRVPAAPNAEPSTCAPALPACDSADAIDLADIRRDLADTDVQAALGSAKIPLYGGDWRPVDGTVFSFVAASGGGFLMGSTSCLGGEPCTPIPPGISKLVADLRALDRQQLADPMCSAFAR
jgi:hypothetical protein